LIVSGDIHYRAPVILEEGAWTPWPTGETAEAAHEIKDACEPKLIYHPVPKAVGPPKNDVPTLVEPLRNQREKRAAPNKLKLVRPAYACLRALLIASRWQPPPWAVRSTTSPIEVIEHYLRGLKISVAKASSIGLAANKVRRARWAIAS
jgi:hypothetical protein